MFHNIDPTNPTNLASLVLDSSWFPHNKIAGKLEFELPTRHSEESGYTQTYLYGHQTVSTA